MLACSLGIDFLASVGAQDQTLEQQIFLVKFLPGGVPDVDTVVDTVGVDFPQLLSGRQDLLLLDSFLGLQPSEDVAFFGSCSSSSLVMMISQYFFLLLRATISSNCNFSISASVTRFSSIVFVVVSSMLLSTALFCSLILVHFVQRFSGNRVTFISIDKVLFTSHLHTGNQMKHTFTSPVNFSVGCRLHIYTVRGFILWILQLEM